MRRPHSRVCAGVSVRVGGFHSQGKSARCRPRRVERRAHEARSSPPPSRLRARLARHGRSAPGSPLARSGGGRELVSAATRAKSAASAAWRTAVGGRSCGPSVAGGSHDLALSAPPATWPTSFECCGTMVCSIRAAEPPTFKYRRGHDGIARIRPLDSSGVPARGLDNRVEHDPHTLSRCRWAYAPHLLPCSRS